MNYSIPIKAKKKLILSKMEIAKLLNVSYASINRCENVKQLLYMLLEEKLWDYAKKIILELWNKK